MKRSMWLLSVCVLALPALAGAGTGAVTIPQKIPFKQGANVPTAVRKECNLPTAASNAIRDSLQDAKVKVVQAGSVSSGTPGRALQLTITRMLAPGGGMFSGPKSLTIEGVLWSGGKSVGSFRAVRNTMGGGGTCTMLENNAKEIGEDIAEWLKAPKAHALLGDAS